MKLVKTFKINWLAFHVKRVSMNTKKDKSEHERDDDNDNNNDKKQNNEDNI